MAATIIAASIPVLRGFFKNKVSTTGRSAGPKGRSNGSSEQTADGESNSVAKENIRLSSRVARGNSLRPQPHAYTELDELDLEGAYPVR